MSYKKRKPNRLKKYNYSQNGYYYVTINTYQNKEFFGNVENNRVILNEYGEIAEYTWKEIPDHFKGIENDEYIVMPNHVHGILIIKHARDRHACPLHENNRCQEKLPVIVGSYKSSVTRKIRRLHKNSDFKWQRSYYDHVIRTKKGLNKIREYIHNNPGNWVNSEDSIENM